MIKKLYFYSLLLILGLTFSLQTTIAKTLNSPLVLKDRGSFYVGGEKTKQDFVELGSLREADTVTNNQMFVEYMIENTQNPKIPLVLIHGAGLSGNSYDTTPDGRMGWYEYFVRKYFPTYIVDQVGRGRSGFNQEIFNNVGAGRIKPSQLPKITRMGDLHAVWINFRIGEKEGIPFKDTQFPINAISEFSKMSIADLASNLASPNPNYKTLAKLAKKLKGAVLIGHSQSGHYPLESALIEQNYVKGMIILEGSCSPRPFNDNDFEVFKKIPLLVIYGDYLFGSTELPFGDSWQQRYDKCQIFVDKVNEKGGNAEIIHLPQKGFKGNSHMFMMDKNNLEIANIIIDWIEKNNIKQ